MKNQVKENIGLIVALVATICCIFMFWLGWDMGEKSYQIKSEKQKNELKRRRSLLSCIFFYI